MEKLSMNVDFLHQISNTYHIHYKNWPSSFWFTFYYHQVANTMPPYFIIFFIKKDPGIEGSQRVHRCCFTCQIRNDHSPASEDVLELHGEVSPTADYISCNNLLVGLLEIPHQKLSGKSHACAVLNIFVECTWIGIHCLNHVPHTPWHLKWGSL